MSMTNPNHPKSDWTLPLVAMALSALLYATTVTNMVTQDSITYAATAVRGDFAAWLHPHHLAYDVLLAAVLHLFGTTQPDAAALAVLQGFNLVVSVLAVGAMARLVGALDVDRMRAALIVAVFATANGFWLYSSQIEVYNLAALFCLITLLAFVRERSGRRGAALVAVVCCTLALLSHQTAVFIIAGLGAAILLHDRGSVRVRRLATYVVAPVAITGALYLAAAYHVTGELGPKGVWMFATSYAHTGQWGSISAKNFVKAPYGFLSSFVALEEIVPGSIDPLEVAGVLLFAIGLVLAIVAAVGRRGRALPPVHRALVVVLAVWTLAHAAFVWWWHPSNIEFWIIVMPAVLVGLALLWPPSRPVAVAAPRASRFVVAALGLILAGQLLVNTPGIVRDTTGPSERIERARSVSALTGEDDLLVITSHPGMIGYYQYFSAAELAFPFPAAIGDDPEALERAVSTLRAQVARTVGRRGSVIVEGDPMLVPGSKQGREAAERDAIATWLASYAWRKRPAGADSVLELGPAALDSVRTTLR